MTFFIRMPNVIEPIHTKGSTSRTWYQFFTGIYQGKPTGFVQPQTAPIQSPHNFVAPQGGMLIVNGGNPTQVSYSRDGENFYVVGQTAGMFPLSAGDTLQVQFSSTPPVMTFVPR